MYETVETCIQRHMGRGGVNGRSRLRCVEAKKEGLKVIWHISRGSRTGPVDPTTTGAVFSQTEKSNESTSTGSTCYMSVVAVWCSCTQSIVVLNLSHHTHPVQKVSAHAILINWSLALQCGACSEPSCVLTTMCIKPLDGLWFTGLVNEITVNVMTVKMFKRTQW